MPEFFKLSPFSTKEKHETKEWFVTLMKLEALSKKQLLDIAERLWGGSEGLLPLSDMFLAYEIEHDIEKPRKGLLRKLVEEKFYSINGNQAEDMRTTKTRENKWRWISERLDRMDVLQIIYFYSAFHKNFLKSFLKSFIKKYYGTCRKILKRLSQINEETIKTAFKKKIMKGKLDVDLIVETIEKFYAGEI